MAIGFYRSRYCDVFHINVYWMAVGRYHSQDLHMQMQIEELPVQER